MPFPYCRTIRFQETDAAGVVYFANILTLCHEAYEESLRQWGVDLPTFFGRGGIAVPITHTEADFRRPLRCGETVTIHLTPTPIAADSFEIRYEVLQATGKVAAIALTRHVCIDTATRQRHPLMPVLTQWLQQTASDEPLPTAATPSD